MSVNNRISRRQALKRAVGAAAASFALPQFVKGLSPSPNSQIAVGIIGCGRRNGQLAIGKGGQGAAAPNARIIAVANLNLKRAEGWAKNYKCKAYQDYRAPLGPQGRGSRRLCYARTLALLALHPCLPGRQGHVWRTAAEPHDPRRPADGRGRPQVRPRVPGREIQRSNPSTRKAVELIRNGRIGSSKRSSATTIPAQLGMRLSPAADSRMA